jgi:importin subunit alpha-6/7
VQAAGVKQIRRLLSTEDNPPVKEVLAAGALPILVALLDSPDSKVVFESAWALTNIASTDMTKVVVNSGALPKLIANMMHADGNVREQCMWCVGNIAGDCAEFRDAVFATDNGAGVNNLLLNIQHPDNIKLLRNATWTLSNFCRGKPTPKLAAVTPIIPALAYLITMEDKDVLSDALWGICYLTDGEETLTDAVVTHPGVVPRVIALLGHEELSVAMPALRIVGNIVSSVDRHTQAAIDAGLLTALLPLLRSGRKNVRREACWAVSNVAAGTHAQITSLLSTPGLIQAVLDIMRSSDWHVRKEATWIVCNSAAAGAPEHVCKLVSSGVIEPLVEILSNDDARMLAVVMDAMDAILAVEAKFKKEGNPAAAMCTFAEQFESYGAVTRLEELQEHASHDVYNKSYNLMQKYYPDGCVEAGAEEENTAVASSENSAPAAAALTSIKAGGTFGLGAPTAAPFSASGFITPKPVAAPAVPGAFNFTQMTFA